MKDPIYWRVLRWLYGGFYLLSGMHMLCALFGLVPQPDFKLPPASAAFQKALHDTGFVMQVVAISYIASGGCLLFQRTAPLGAALLAPAMVIIFLTDVLLSDAVVWGSGHAVVLLLLLWHYRSAYVPMWRHQLAAS